MFSKKDKVRSFTIEKCKKCNKEIKRNFKEGDYLFSETTNCSSCDGKLQIEKIYGETIKQL